MLPSSGYFQSVVCPFFKIGLCERPHCHYKHVESNLNEQSQVQWASIENNFDLPTANDAFDSIKDSSTSSSTHSYVPTPVDKCTPKSAGILKTPATTISAGAPTVPEYKPTPISQLKNQYSKSSGLNSAPQNTNFRKRKKFEEYDPAEVKYSRKRVSFDLPYSNDDVAVVDDSEEEGDCGNDSAKFSDDEDSDVKEYPIQQPTNEKVEDKTDKEKPTEKISEFSLVDKILIDVSKNEEYIKNFKQPKTVFKNCDKSLKSTETSVNKNKDSVTTNCEISHEVTKSDGKKETNLDKDKIVNNVVETNEKAQFKVPKDEKTICDKPHKPKSSSSKSESKVHHSSKLKSVKSTKTQDSDKGQIKDSKTEVKSSLKSKSSIDTALKEKSLKEKTSKEKISKEKDKSSKEKSSKDKSGKEKDTKGKSDSEKIVKGKHTSGKPPKEKSTHGSSQSKNSSSKTSTDKSKEKSSVSKHSHEKSKSSKEGKSKESVEKSKNKSSSNHSSSSKSHHKSSSNSKSSHISSKHDKKIEPQPKTSKKIQDEKISSSSVVKHDKNTTLKFADVLDGKVRPVTIPLPIEDDVIMISDSDQDSAGSGSEMDSDTLWECWQIFNEKSDSNLEEKPKDEPLPLKEKFNDGFIPLGKKRLAHQPDIKRKLKSPKREKKILSPAEVMHNRYMKLQNMYARQNEKKETSVFLNSLNKTADGQKKRIATVPNSSLIAAVANKNRLSAIGNSNSSSSSTNNRSSALPPTIVIKPANRVAHVPTVALSPRPIIPASYGSKVATNLRQKYLNNFIDECLKFCLSEEQAYELALEEEKKAYERSTNKTIYLNIAANAMNRLRHRARDGPPTDMPDECSIPPQVSSTTPVLSSRKSISHEMMLAGPQALKHSFSIERKKTKQPELVIRGEALYSSLTDYIMSEEQLISNGFPMPHPFEHGQAVICSSYANRQPLCNDPYKKICSRCSKIYFVDDSGDYVKQQECNFHWGRIFKQRIAGSLESRYTCCQGDGEADGCCIGIGHVFEGSENHLLKGYVRTLQKSPPPDNYFGVYSLDCEMCYTTAGIELTRVTVIGPDMKAVFESFVKPENKVLDYNTRFSGITADDLVGITTSIRDVQAVLLCMFNERTILIGHSLESDFKALKLIHKTVVDTSVVFPHKLGPPYKRALRTLMAEKCSKIIQNSIDGHDSHEDAAACMELMILKIKEDLKSSYR